MSYKKVFLKVERTFPKEGDWDVGISTNGFQWVIFLTFDKRKDALELKKLLTVFLESRGIATIN